jgi:hypothetical protein
MRRTFEIYTCARTHVCMYICVCTDTYLFAVYLMSLQISLTNKARNVHTVACLLKARIVKLAETAVARERLWKQGRC